MCKIFTRDLEQIESLQFVVKSAAAYAEDESGFLLVAVYRTEDRLKFSRQEISGLRLEPKFYFRGWRRKKRTSGQLSRTARLS